MKRLLRAALCAGLVMGSVTVGTVPAEAQVRRFISFQNACNHQVRVYISHADGYRNWHVHGPFTLDAFEGPIRLEANNTTLTQTENHDLYFYAESLDGSGGVWDGSDHRADYNGVTYNMRRAVVEVRGGWLNARLTCDD